MPALFSVGRERSAGAWISSSDSEPHPGAIQLLQLVATANLISFLDALMVLQRLPRGSDPSSSPGRSLSESRIARSLVTRLIAVDVH